jgi:hypothetical protein
MQCDIDSITVLQAAVKMYGADVQVGSLMWLDTIGEYILVNVTPPRNRSFRGKFYYRKGSFDAKAPDLANQ